MKSEDKTGEERLLLLLLLLREGPKVPALRGKRFLYTAMHLRAYLMCEQLELFLYPDFYTITIARFSSTWGGMCPNDRRIRSTKEKEAEQVVVRAVKCKG
jgi:hypothetical protein